MFVEPAWHSGALFLAELAEFSPHVLETLREPLEEGAVTISRAGSSATYPARFRLVAAQNPCRLLDHTALADRYAPATVNKAPSAPPAVSCGRSGRVPGM